LYYVRYAFKMGWSMEKIHELSRIDHFFLDQVKQLVEFEDVLCSYARLIDVPAEVFFEAKQLGYSDAQLANLYLGKISTDTILEVRARRKSLGIEPVYKLVDTCAAEFEAVTPYYYSTYEQGTSHASSSSPVPSAQSPIPAISITPGDDEIRVTDRRKVVIIGGGPNRIGQGIEFDYCCVHAAFAARDLGFESVMINSNPETVSTDYDTSDLLFFEPLTLEDTLNVIERLNGAGLGKVSDLSAVDGVTGLTAAAVSHDPLDQVGREFAGKEHCEIPGDLIAQLARAAAEKGIGELGVVSASRWYRKDAGRELNGVVVNAVDRTGKVWLAAFPSGANPRLERFVQDPAQTWENFFEHLHPQVCRRADRWMRSGGLIEGTIVQFGGQTPLNLAKGLVGAGVPIIGTTIDSIDLAEDRDRFDAMLERLKLSRPSSGIAYSIEGAVKEAERLGYPVLIRPSYVLGGRGMEICQDEKALRSFIMTAIKASDLEGAPVLIDKFLDGAIELDVDVVADFETGDGKPSSNQALIAGVMQQIEQAGIHSGDSACTLPPASLSPEMVAHVKDVARSLARELKVRGLMNVQMAVKENRLYIIEVNPRASRTVPFVGKATHMQWPAIAAKVMMGKTLKDLSAREIELRNCYAIKESVFPFSKFPGVDVVLGPEMRSTGEVMGFDRSLPVAFAKAQMASGVPLPLSGGVFISVRDADKEAIVPVARELKKQGFTLYTTGGTGELLEKNGVQTQQLKKVGTGFRPNVVDLMTDGKISLVINTPTRTGWQTDEGKIRATAVRLGISMITTATAAAAAAGAITAMRESGWGVAALQDYSH
ncbi:MAG TPA: ATP-grasp domain-containing protein, partial [Phycisphaerales bacterium]|nr:ATP-grasp domain-containing protein [Phycisphaerales bacterium]